MITMNGALHPKEDVDRLYVLRTKSERGLRGGGGGGGGGGGMQIRRSVMNY